MSPSRASQATVLFPSIFAGILHLCSTFLGTLGCFRPALLRGVFVGGCGASVRGELTLAMKRGKGDKQHPKQHVARRTPARKSPPGGIGRL